MFALLTAATSCVSAVLAEDIVSRRYEYSEVHMGLPVRIVLHAADEATARAAATAAFARIAVLDQMMSDYRVDSELRRLEQHHGEWTAVSPELYDIIERAVAIARASDGGFDPTVAPVVALWREARRTRRMPALETLAAATSLVGWRNIGLDPSARRIALRRPGMRLDLGGIAKGYILQEALRTLQSLHVARALIESGGDIVVGDAPPGRRGWRIDALSANRAMRLRAMHLANAAISTSGDEMQFVDIDGVRYSHVVDPRTGLGLTNHLVAVVIGPDGATADALATALTVIGIERSGKLLSQFPGFVGSVRRIDRRSQERSSRRRSGDQEIRKVFRILISYPPVKLS
jgi:thiamine biosynthesis lipoprotein